MSEEKKIEILIPEVKRPYKKYSIIGGSVVLVISLLLAAILVGIYFFTDVQKEVVKFAYTRGENTREEVTSDPNTNVVQYHVNSDVYELWAVNDFNRDIQVTKIHYSGGTNCFVTPLNRTLAQDPSQIPTPAEINPEAPKTLFHVTYRAGKDPISDVTFLCKPAKVLCNGISTYWVFPSCAETSETKRNKRGWSICGNFGWISICYS